MYDKLKQDIISSMKEKNTLKLQTLRGVKGSVDLEHINKKVEITDEAFLKVKPTSPKDMGLIMKEITPLLKGKCDMKEVSLIIKDKLSNL